MNFLRRTVLATAAAMALVPAAGFAQETIKVGEINHYKRMAAFAEPYKLGIELALSEINEAGGVLGQELEFIFRDDQGDPAEAVKIAEAMTRAITPTKPACSALRLSRAEFVKCIMAYLCGDMPDGGASSAVRRTVNRSAAGKKRRLTCTAHSCRAAGRRATRRPAYDHRFRRSYRPS